MNRKTKNKILKKFNGTEVSTRSNKSKKHKSRLVYWAKFELF